MSDNNNGNGGKENFVGRVRRFFSQLLSLFRIPSKKTFLEPTLFVFIAFAVTVLVCYVLVHRIVSEQVKTQSQSLFISAYRHVSAVSSHMESTLRHLSNEVEFRVAEGQTLDEIHQYLKTASAQLNFWADLEENTRSFQSGQFRTHPYYRELICELDGQLLGSDDWKVPEGYDVRKQSWYIDAKNGNGKLIYTSPDLSECTNLTVVRLGKALFDEEGQFIGILSIAVAIAEMSDFLELLRSSRGFVVLVNPERQIAIHPDPKLIGKPLAKVSRGGADVIHHIDGEGASFVYSTAVSAAGIQSVHYCERLQNDWLLISVILDAGRPIRQIATFLTVLGVVMAGTLCFFLARLYREKDQANLHSRSKSMFLAKMSHEIRTPMNVIAGLSRLIVQEKNELPPKILKYSVEINHAANNLLAIIKDVLDLSKIESGNLEIVKVSFTLGSLLEDVISIIRSRMFEKELQFISFVESRIPNNLIGDVVHIRQILLNILGNAAKYTRKGHVAFDVHGEQTGEKTVMLSFDVQDTGIGIRREEQLKLFTDFTQAGAESNWNIEGTGLGLSISYELANRLGGSISLISQHGQGTTFTVTIPLEIENDIPCAVVNNPSEHHVLVYEPRVIYEQSLMRTLDNLNVSYKRVQNIFAFSEALYDSRRVSHIFIASFVYDDVVKFLGESALADTHVILLCDNPDQYQVSSTRSVMLPIDALYIASVLNYTPGALGEKSEVAALFRIPAARILIVDDNQSNLLVAEGLLAHYECQIDFATSGQEALQQVQQCRYDLIFMDHMMPGMDGLETTIHIRELAKQKEHEYFGTVPIIALTANAVFGMREVFLQNGMDDFVPKPIDPVRLHEILMTWIPKEKQQIIETQTWKSKQEEGETFQILGVDTQIGITRTGGTLDGYIRVVSILCSEWETKVKAMEVALSSDDLTTYTRYVHTYKSLLATIGAIPISETAAILETAANNADRTTINLHHGSFIHDLREVAMSIAAALREREEQMDDVESTAEDMKWLHMELAVLRGAIEEVNMQEINSIMDGIFAQRWTKEITEQLEKIIQNITLYEWAKAVDMIKELSGLCSHE